MDRASQRYIPPVEKNLIPRVCYSFLLATTLPQQRITEIHSSCRKESFSASVLSIQPGERCLNGASQRYVPPVEKKPYSTSLFYIPPDDNVASTVDLRDTSFLMEKILFRESAIHPS